MAVWAANMMQMGVMNQMGMGGMMASPGGHRLTYVGGCGGGGFVESFPPFLRGRVNESEFFDDIRAINAIINAGLKSCFCLPMGSGHALGGLLTIVGFAAFAAGGFSTGTHASSAPPVGVMVGFGLFFLGGVVTTVAQVIGHNKVQSVFGTAVPAKLNELNPKYNRHGANLQLDRQMGLIRSRGMSQVNYVLVVQDTSAAAPGPVVAAPPPGVFSAPAFAAPMQGVVMQGVAMPPPPPPGAAATKFCSKCGMAAAPGAKFCGNCGGLV